MSQRYDDRFSHYMEPIQPRSETMSIPELEPRCGSWIVLNAGKPMIETFERNTADQCALMGFEVVTALQWLQRFNKSVRES
jgi:hypothetical protein